MIKRIVMYARSSTGKASIQNQLRKIRRSIPQGSSVVGEFADIGAATGERPGLEECLSRLAAGIGDTLFVASLDRLSRTRKQIADIRQFAEQHGVTVVTVVEE